LVPIIRVSGLRKDYRRRPAVRGVDLTVARGEIYGLIGPDGAGKSTLLKALAGVLTFDGGLLEVFGLPVATERGAERVKGRIGFMPQGLGLHLYAELSVEENIDFFARLRMVPREALAERKRILLGMTRLDRFRDRPMKHLSGGMKQKLGLVCTLIHEPELVILDEPTTGVDPVSRRASGYPLDVGARARITAPSAASTRRAASPRGAARAGRCWRRGARGDPRARSGPVTLRRSSGRPLRSSDEFPQVLGPATRCS
jgi:ABC-type Na+ transport system ATPase subunit NatA